ncbi:hypothetical protein RRG08_047147 [Elysia crispata]|uniref:Uncharacterized protein n=1 Tax=Elysia crispata TaxID=231223 RepID=A0AAE0YN18_9GAST|nr:hypothetical protein RRG08_047147 [Elysia crispata]
MRKVLLKEGKSCFDRRQPGHKNKRSYISLESQPGPGEILILRRYYTKHTDNAKYQKRVSWLEIEQAMSCACHEYLGKCLLQPHRGKCWQARQLRKTET